MDLAQRLTRVAERRLAADDPEAALTLARLAVRRRATPASRRVLVEALLAGGRPHEARHLARLLVRQDTGPEARRLLDRADSGIVWVPVDSAGRIGPQPPEPGSWRDRYWTLLSFRLPPAAYFAVVAASCTLLVLAAPHGADLGVKRLELTAITAPLTWLSLPWEGKRAVRRLWHALPVVSRRVGGVIALGILLALMFLT